MKTLKRYKIKYFFDGYGEGFVEAKNEEEARDKFFDGDTDLISEAEWGENYNIDMIEQAGRRRSTDTS